MNQLLTKCKALLEIYIAFFKIGALTFGGGYTMLPIIQKEVIENKHWISEEEMLDYYAVGQCLPGIIAINTATFIGRRIKGRPGGVAAAFGVATPSLLIIMVIAAFIKNFVDIPAVQYAFNGIRVAVAALIVDAIIKMWPKSIKDVYCFLIYLAVFVLSAFAGVSTVYVIIGAVLCGLLIHYLKKRGAHNDAA